MGLGTAEPVGLKGRHNAPARKNLPRSGQGCGNLRRVVTVVVHHGNTALFALEFEPPPHSLESRQTFRTFVKRNVNFHGSTNGCKGVKNVVASRLRQTDLAQEIAVQQNLKTVDAPAFQRNGPKRVILGETVREHRALHLWQQGQNAGVITTNNIQAVKGHIVHELHKGAVNGLAAFIVIQMILIHIGDNIDNWQQAEKGAVRLVGFGNEVFAVAKMRVGAIDIEPSADNDGGIKPGCVKNGGRERGGRGLAVGARDGYALPQAHELGQHLGTGNDGDIALARFDQFGIVVTDGGGFDQYLHIPHVFRSVANGYMRAKLAQMAHHGGVAHVRTGYLVFEIKQNLGNTAHARTADAHHMDMTNLAVHVAPLKKV